MVYEERVSCNECRASLVVEYTAGTGGVFHVTAQCPHCHKSSSVALPRPASVFLVRRVDEEPRPRSQRKA